MRHIQQSPSSITLNPHILRFRQSGQRSEGSRPRNLRLVVLVGRQVGDASDGITLHLDVRRHHLTDQRRQSTQQDNRNFVLGCSFRQSRTLLACLRLEYILLTARLPSAALAARCTSRSGFCRRNKMGSNVSRSTSRTSTRPHRSETMKRTTQIVMGREWLEDRPRSVISAKVKLALRCRSTLSEYTNVLSARSGSPLKKSTSDRCSERQSSRRNKVKYFVRGGGDDMRSPDTVADPTPLPVRCPVGRARRVHHRATGLHVEI